MSLAPLVVLIDNYDSFAWNVYEYLCREGARVTVFRNDKTTVEEIEEIDPDLIMISPGPGHPDTDSGISCDVIKHFMGKKPIFGICMGLQCIVSMLGGTVESAGEIVHGKTSIITHTNKGVFAGVTQGVSVTRYHSLAANITTLPSCLEVTARTDSGLIMGVRHKEYSVEAVQFHPESIISEEGQLLFRNFLRQRGGLRMELQPQAIGSVLDQIFEKRRIDIEKLSARPGQTLRDLEIAIDMRLAPKAISFHDRLKNESAQAGIAVIAEIKRASPSKGAIDLGGNAPLQAQSYTRAGAAAISVLTEPTWFHGDLQDLRFTRCAVEETAGANRPAVLLKDFVFSRYQIAEARLAGADAVLLIVKMLSDETLADLYQYAYKLGIEALVEVASTDEMIRARKLGAAVIGINNRDLHTFEVDMQTTSSLLAGSSEEGVLYAALSGIQGPEHVQEYRKHGVRALLVGEALMRSENPAEFISSLKCTQR